MSAVHLEPAPVAQPADPDKLNAFLGRMVGDLGAIASGALVLLGDRLGLFRAMRSGEPMTPDDLGATHRHPRALRARMAVGAGRGRLRGLRRRGRHLPPQPGAGRRVRRRRQPRLDGRCVRGAVGSVARRAESRRSLPPRARPGLARAQRLPVPRHRAVLPARLQRQPRVGVAARARRRGRQAAARRHGGRRGLRPRRVHAGDGARVSELAVRRLRLPRAVGRGAPPARRATPAWPTCASKSRTPRTSRAASTWWRSSTACTTWATRSARPRTCARRSSPTAPG